MIEIALVWELCQVHNEKQFEKAILPEKNIIPLLLQDRYGGFLVSRSTNLLTGSYNKNIASLLAFNRTGCGYQLYFYNF